MKFDQAKLNKLRNFETIKDLKKACAELDITYIDSGYSFAPLNMNNDEYYFSIRFIDEIFLSTYSYKSKKLCLDDINEVFYHPTYFKSFYLLEFELLYYNDRLNIFESKYHYLVSVNKPKYISSYSSFFEKELNKSMRKYFKNIFPLSVISKYELQLLFRQNMDFLIGKSMIDCLKLCNTNKLMKIKYGLIDVIYKNDIIFGEESYDAKNSNYNFNYIIVELTHRYFDSKDEKIAFFNQYKTRIANFALNLIKINHRWPKDLPLNILQMTDFILKNDDMLVIYFKIKEIGN